MRNACDQLLIIKVIRRTVELSPAMLPLQPLRANGVQGSCMRRLLMKLEGGPHGAQCKFNAQMPGKLYCI